MMTGFTGPNADNTVNRPFILTPKEIESVSEYTPDPFILGVHAVMDAEDVEDIAEGLMELIRQGKYEEIICAMKKLEKLSASLCEIAEEMKTQKAKQEGLS